MRLHASCAGITEAYLYLIAQVCDTRMLPQRTTAGPQKNDFLLHPILLYISCCIYFT